jgi:uncharacterized protein YcgI (DUF1989 family)
MARRRDPAMSGPASILIPPREGRAVALARGRLARVVNSEGRQVVDTWAFDPSDPLEFLSMEHSRVATYKILFEPGDVLVTNRRRPILAITADTSPGIHDTLYAACDAASYALEGKPGHPNCADNLRAALASFGLAPPVVPCPWNLFEHAPIVGGRYLRDDPSEARPGDYVELRAETDCVLVCSACPSEGYGISGSGPTRGARIDLL